MKTANQEAKRVKGVLLFVVFLASFTNVIAPTEANCTMAMPQSERLTSYSNFPPPTRGNHEMAIPQARYRGQWEGKTSDGYPIQFVVDENNAITELSLDIPFSLSYNQRCVYKFKTSGLVPINNGQFEAKILPTSLLGFDSTAPDPSISGTFSSTTNCSGATSRFRIGAAFCAGGITYVLSGGAIEVKFSAQKKAVCSTVTEIKPAATTVGNDIIITGVNLADVTAVRFYKPGFGAPAKFMVDNDTQITVEVPVGAEPGEITLVQDGCPDIPAGRFTVLDSPVPTIVRLDPAVATASGQDFKLTVKGANFLKGSVVRWNDYERLTTFISDTVLTAQITAADMANAGVASVKVFNPAPGGGASNEMSFTINRRQPQAQPRSQSPKARQRAKGVTQKP